MPDDEPETETAPDPSKLTRDPDALKHAHGKYGDYLKKVGLPFEPEELEENEGDSARATDAAADESE